MKKQLYLYIVIVSVLMLFFTYMFYSKKESSDKRQFESDLKMRQTTIDSLNNKLSDADYFSLEQDDKAQNYLEGHSIQKLIPQVREALLAFNDDPEGNKYVDQPKIGEQKFIINKIKILNHRWIIADYSNGQLWGEVLIKYFIEKDNSISFQTMDTFLFPKQQY